MLRSLGHDRITLVTLQNNVLGYYIRTQYTQHWDIAIRHSIGQQLVLPNNDKHY